MGNFNSISADQANKQFVSKDEMKSLETRISQFANDNVTTKLSELETKFGQYAPAASYVIRDDLRNYAPAGDYALKSELRNYAPAGDYALKSELINYAPAGDYALKSELRNYAPAGDYALKSELRNYAPASELRNYYRTVPGVSFSENRVNIGSHGLRASGENLDVLLDFPGGSNFRLARFGGGTQKDRFVVWQNDTNNTGLFYYNNLNEFGRISAPAPPPIAPAPPPVTPTLIKYPLSSLTSNTSGNVTVTASVSPGNAFMLFNNNISGNEYWEGANRFWADSGTHKGGYEDVPQVQTLVSGTNHNGDWVQIQLPTPITLRRYVFTSSNQLPTRRGPRDFVVAGSNNGSTWTLLDNKQNIMWSGYGSRSFDITNTTAFTYYRFIFKRVGTTDNDTTYQQNSVNLSEIEMYAS